MNLNQRLICTNFSSPFCFHCYGMVLSADIIFNSRLAVWMAWKKVIAKIKLIFFHSSGLHSDLTDHQVKFSNVSRPATLLRASYQIQHGRIFSAQVRNQIHWVLVSLGLCHMKCWRSGISSKMTQCLLEWRLTPARLWLFKFMSNLLNIPAIWYSKSPHFVSLKYSIAHYS
jgi:hypothetical protein